jgi:DNA repair protein RadD
MALREYQRRAIDMLNDWFSRHETGHPCLEMPTGSGKSHVIAAYCQEALSEWPETRILMLTHVKELIEQNAAKMREYWPTAPLGIYSAGLRQRDASQSIVFGGVQSLARKADEIGHIDLLIVDEAHRIPAGAAGQYRDLIDDLTKINPALRVIGLTATPYRLGHGMITDPPALFSSLIVPVTYMELLKTGHLARLTCKRTATTYNLDDVRRRGGEYVEADLDAAVNDLKTNEEVAAEIMRNAEDRKSWIVFAVSVAHAYGLRDALLRQGVTAATVVGETPSAERAEIIAAFKAGEIQAITNANVLTTGFDAPNVDLIAACRPSLSTSLYVQMLGRGTRTAEGKKDCLVLDFAGIVSTHGPFDNPVVRKPGQKGGDAPVKVCPECDTLVHLSVMLCPTCGHVWERKGPTLKLHDDAILSDAADAQVMRVGDWRWSIDKAKSGVDILSVRYYEEALAGRIIRETFPLWHGGGATHMAMKRLAGIAARINTSVPNMDRMNINDFETWPAPAEISYRKNGKFFDVVKRTWRKPIRARWPFGGGLPPDF